ncbi:MAG TPA: galactose-1-phosphate uridylyltransferase [Frankiaceae bacterium]|nr:galactose-1-phosphate uridylyltransferase [Frankiaceae bacterium]
MKRTVGRLADGREIVYFDEGDDAVRELYDPRDLPATSTSSEVRHDPLLDEWVAVASHRQGRTFLPPADECPLCPSRDGRHTEIPSPDYDVVVFENRFPSLAPTAAIDDGTVDGGTSDGGPWALDGLVPRRPGAGRCEVVCFTSDHDTSFARLTPERVRLIVEAWADRTRELAALPQVEQVFCFENRGEEIGVTLSHPHGQIYAYPFVTPRTRRMLDAARRYAARTGGRSLFDDVVAAERAASVRVVAETGHWLAFVPAAAHWPFEVHLYPHRRVPDLPATSDAERDDLARLYLDVLRRLDGLFGLPMPYVAAWHQAPARAGRDLAALHLELFSIRRAPGKLKYLAGSESGMDVFVNDVTPERAAAVLREAGG